MNHFPNILLVCLISCLTAGCQSGPDPDQPVAEFPSTSIKDYRARDSTVLVLWHWTPDTSEVAQIAMAHDKNKHTIEVPLQLKEVSINTGQIVGFRERENQLFAIAGDKKLALPPGHYSWQLLSQDPRNAPKSPFDTGNYPSDETGLTDPLKDKLQWLDDKYNGTRRRESDEPAPDLSK